MEEKVKLLLLNPVKGVKTVEYSDYRDLYPHLECEHFDITNRIIGGKVFDVICDDEGLLKDNPVVSMVDMAFNPMLVGNLIFANHDADGNTTSLSQEDIRLIMENLIYIEVNGSVRTIVICD